MDADQIRALKPKLRTFLKSFDDCFQRSDTRHVPVYVEDQLSDLPRKNCEPIAGAAKVLESARRGLWSDEAETATIDRRGTRRRAGHRHC